MENGFLKMLRLEAKNSNNKVAEEFMNKYIYLVEKFMPLKNTIDKNWGKEIEDIKIKPPNLLQFQINERNILATDISDKIHVISGLLLEIGTFKKVRSWSNEEVKDQMTAHIYNEFKKMGINLNLKTAIYIESLFSFVNAEKISKLNIKSIDHETKIGCWIVTKHISPGFWAKTMEDEGSYEIYKQTDKELELEMLHPKEDIPDLLSWNCKKCNEENEGSFDSCWQCQTLNE